MFNLPPGKGTLRSKKKMLFIKIMSDFNIRVIAVKVIKKLLKSFILICSNKEKPISMAKVLKVSVSSINMQAYVGANFLAMTAPDISCLILPLK